MYPITWLGCKPKFQPLFHGCDSNVSLVFRALLFRYAHIHSNRGQSWRWVTDHLLGPFSVSFTGRLRPDPPILNPKQAQKLMYHFTQSCFCSLHTTVSLTLSSALGSLVGPSRQKTETLIPLPCYELTANMSSPGATWQENREKKEAVKIHPMFLEPELLWSEKVSPPSEF